MNNNDEPNLEIEINKANVTRLENEIEKLKLELARKDGYIERMKEELLEHNVFSIPTYPIAPHNPYNPWSDGPVYHQTEHFQQRHETIRKSTTTPESVGNVDPNMTYVDNEDKNC